MRFSSLHAVAVFSILAVAVVALSVCRGDSPRCAEGEQFCPDGVGCVNIFNHREHCGGCGNACGGCDRCTFGECEEACCGDEFNCGTVTDFNCVDRSTSREHCGSCNNPCAEDQVCFHSECTACDPPLMICNDRCVDPRSDIQHCGGCMSLCHGQCVCGECYETGTTPPDGGACVDTDGDADVDSDVDGDADSDADAELDAEIPDAETADAQ